MYLMSILKVFNDFNPHLKNAGKGSGEQFHMLFGDNGRDELKRFYRS